VDCCMGRDVCDASYRGGGNVGQIGSNARGVDDIIESELVDQLAGLEEKGQRLCVVSYVFPDLGVFAT